MTALPADALCERCWSPVLDNQRWVRLAHIEGSTLRGDIRWVDTFVHYWRAGGCDLEPATPAP